MRIFKNIFGSGKLKHPLDISSFMVDMHSHLIPGIDDGVKDYDSAVKIIRELISLGYKKVITTPHIMADIYKNDPDIILKGLSELREVIKKENLDIEIDAAAEYLMDDSFKEHLKNGNLMTLKDRYILVEVPYFSAPPDLYENIFDLQINNYKIIMAHPERYSFWYDDFSKLEDLKNRDVYFQLNLLSLTGYYPYPVKKIAEKLIDAEMIDFVGSDLHNTQQLSYFRKILNTPALKKLISSEKIKNRLLY
ncbi:MAG: capsular biosynthesis protein [Bacteroidetes bacterium]|nr:capsular biosynthesis protein [Bacteroidota bacterium]